MSVRSSDIVRVVAATAALLATTLVLTTWSPPAVAARPRDASEAAPDTWPIDVRPDTIVEPGHLVEQFGPTTGAHVDLINARAWHDGGIDGSGVTIGVIDFFDVARYWDESEHGPLPVAGKTAKCFDAGNDCTDELFDGVDAGGEGHGVAVVETILDTAPGAQILLGQARTVGDYQRLIEWFAARGVDVINRSLGSRYDGPGDGRGALDSIADDAVSRGILWVNSGGNNGRNKYYRHPVRLSGDRVAFGPTGDTTFLQFTGCISLGGIRWANDWDTPAAERTDYDAYLWESPTGDPAGGTIVASSRQPQRLGASPIENFPSSRCPAVGTSLYLEVRWVAGDIDGDLLEILDYGSGIASLTSAAGSAAVPVVDSSNPGVLAVGAVDPAAGNAIAGYSSRGPSNDGRILPDLAAPANIDNTVLGRFAGTSAASAVVAGAAALVLDAGMATGAAATAGLLRHMTVDRGSPGPDNEFGRGQLLLPDPPVAAAPSPSTFLALDEPVRALDTRPASAKGPRELIGPVARGDILRLPVVGTNGLPADGVTAVAVNLVSVDADRPSYIQALPTNGAQLAGFSNLNIDAAGQTRANFAIIPVGADGSISIYSTANGHIVVDLLGSFRTAPTAAAGGRFVELSRAERILDTRRDAPVAPLLTGQVRRSPMPAGVDPADVAALVVTVTAAGSTGPGWVQVFPSGRPGVIASTSTVNTSTGGAVANTAIVPVTGGGISVTGLFASGGSSDVIIDAIGYITSAAAPVSTGGRYVGVTPTRALDSRIGGTRFVDGQSTTVDATAVPGIDIPVTASGVVWNATIVDVTRPGFLRVWADDARTPATSALNWSVAGEVRASAVISAVGAGRARFLVEDGSANLSTAVADLVIDVFGYFT